MSSILHRLAHILHLNVGYVTTALDHDRQVWVAFRCAGCGQISRKHMCFRTRGGQDAPPADGEFR